MAPTVLAIHGCTVALGEGHEELTEHWMTRAERRQCDALATPHLRADYRASRLAAKRATMRAIRGADAADIDVYAPRSLRRVSVERRQGDAPVVRILEQDGEWKPFRGALSLAHRDGRAAAAVSDFTGRVGIDIERSWAVGGAHLRYFTTESEVAQGPADPAELWALKEAAWKAVGMGAAHLRAVELEFDATRRVTAVRVHSRRQTALAAVLRPWPLHVVAVIRLEAA